MRRAGSASGGLARTIAGAGLVATAFALPLLLGEGCIPDTAPDDVRSIEGFVECLNNRIVGGDIADAVQCLPRECTLTLTKSGASAQPACSHGGCQLPRVLVNCPGPPRFMPSFSLCVSDGGLQRVEIGEVVNTQGHMRMADLHVGPGGYTFTTPASVVSVVTDATPDAESDSADCWTCHHVVPAAVGEEAISKPEPYEIFGVDCVIGTDEPCREPDAGSCNGIEDVSAQTLDEVCACISQGVNEDGHPLDSDEGRLADALCQELIHYQQTRGICGSAERPTPAGPSCSLEGEDCDPYEDGAISSTPTGYTCQEVQDGVRQCVSSRSCVEYSLQGGGKFLDPDGVSFVRVEVGGRAAVDGDCPVCDSTHVSAELRAFDHAANRLVESLELSSVTATDLGGGDFSVEGEGTASVDGAPANVRFEASRSGADLAFELEDTDAPGSLAGGTGEPGRSALELDETPVP